MSINIFGAEPLEQNIVFAKEIYGYDVITVPDGIYLFHNSIQDVYSNQYIQLTNNAPDILEIKKQFLLQKKRLSIVIPSFVISQPVELLRANSIEIFKKEVYMSYDGFETETSKVFNNLKLVLDTNSLIFKDVFQKVFATENNNNPYNGLDLGYLKLIDYSYINQKPDFKVENFIILSGNLPVGCITLVSNSVCSFIYNAGTLESFRKQGIGTFATFAIIKHWKKNQQNQQLFLVSAEGVLENWYAKLGFRTIFSQTIYREL